MSLGEQQKEQLASLNISTGNIDILGGGIGNQNSSAKDIAKVVAANSQGTAAQLALMEERRRQTTKVFVFAGGVVVVFGFATLVFFATKK